MAFVIRMEQANSIEDIQELTELLHRVLQNPRYARLEELFLQMTIWNLTYKGGIDKDFTTIRTLQEMSVMLNTEGMLWKDRYIVEGEARGRTLGATSEARLVLRELVEERFGFMPTEILTYIENSTNTEKLRSLSRSLFRVKDLKEFTELLTPAQ